MGTEFEELTPTVRINQIVDIPGIYFNGFSLGMSPSDVSMILTVNGAPQANINMSFTTAKSLKDFLETALRELEEATGQTLMTTEFIEQKIREAQRKSEK